MSKFDSPWNNSFSELTGYSFKIISDAIEILYNFYMDVYNRIKNKENNKQESENKKILDSHLLIVKSDQNTARINENKVLIPSLNLSNMNSTHFNFK